MPSLETQVLRNVQRSVPFNSVSNMFLVHGETPKPEFGGNCLVQAAAIRRELEATLPGIFVSFHNERGTDARGHVVAVGEDGDDRLLYEVSGMAAEPVSLSKVQRQGHVLMPTVPVANGVCRHLLFQVLSPGSQMLLMTTIDSSNRALGATLINAEKEVRMPTGTHPFDEIAARKVRKELHLHLLEDDCSKSEVDMDTRTGRMWAKKTGSERVYMEQRRAFQAEMQRIAKCLGVKRKELMEFFMEGWEFYKQLRPDYADDEEEA